MNELTAFGQFVLNGFFASSIYALLSLGLVIVFGVLKIGDFAQGALYALSAYIVFAAMHYLGLPYGAAAPLALVCIAAMSWINGRFVYLPLRRISLGATFIGALAVLLILVNILILLFDIEPQMVVSPFGEATIRLGGTALSAQKAFFIVSTALLVITTSLLLRYTRWGKALRALSQNAEAAALVGVNIRAITSLAFVWAGVLVGAGGALTAPIWPFEPTSGTLLILKAFAIAAIGMGRVRGALFGALLVGISETMVQAYWLAQFSDLIPFALLAVVMLLRPETLGPCEAHQPSAVRRAQWSIPLPPTRYLAVALGLLTLLLPLLIHIDNFGLHLLILTGLNVILVSSLDLLTGYGGIPSLAHAGFWGIGAYASALLMMRAGWTFPAALVGAILFTIGAALIIGLIGRRLREPWTSFTFIVGVIITMLFTSLDAVTRGPRGLINIPPPSFALPGLGSITLNPFRDKLAYFYLVLALVLLTLWLKSRIVNSRMGQALIAIREDEGLAQAVGIPTERYKLLAFLVSAALAGIAGSLYAHYLTYLNPELFTFVQSFDLFVMNLIGGAATLLGPVIGPVTLTVFAELTHPISASIAEIVFGLLLILTLIYMPDGLAGGVRKVFAGRSTQENLAPEAEEVVP